eukprot:jgi/Pico_ML_1/51853/g2677.t1
MQLKRHFDFNDSSPSCQSVISSLTSCISDPKFPTFFLNLSTPLKLTNGSAKVQSGS